MQILNQRTNKPTLWALRVKILGIACDLCAARTVLGNIFILINKEMKWEEWVNDWA